MPEVRSVQTIVTEDARALAEQAGGLILSRIRDAFAASGAARIILAGGTTPRQAYTLLSTRILADKVPVERLAWFFGDERWVTPDHPESNEGMARETLLRRIAAPEATIHSWNAGRGDPLECARHYGQLVRNTMGTAAHVADLLILGLGADGHTGSLFPGATAYFPGSAGVPVGADVPWDAAAVEVGKDRGWRLTLCPGFLGTSRCVIFLVAGRDKAAALRRAREGEPSTPGSWIRGETTIFIVTRDAMGPERPDTGPPTRHA
jgi:6-phosphogluconolactonase